MKRRSVRTALNFSLGFFFSVAALSQEPLRAPEANRYTIVKVVDFYADQRCFSTPLISMNFTAESTDNVRDCNLAARVIKSNIGGVRINGRACMSSANDSFAAACLKQSF